MKISKVVDRAFQVAVNTRKNSHSPYSKFKVGAAIKLKGCNEIWGGCNVENASYGGTVCAERVALWAGIASQGRSTVEFVVVVTDEKTPTVPCALCLQALAEFCPDSTKIYLGNLKSIREVTSFKKLLPRAFRSFRSDEK